MTELNGYRMGGCKLQIEEAKPREGENFDDFYFRNRAGLMPSTGMYCPDNEGT